MVSKQNVKIGRKQQFQREKKIEITELSDPAVGGKNKGNPRR